MAYQPVHVKGIDWSPLGRIGDAFMQGEQLRLQRDAQAASNLQQRFNMNRQTEGDFQADLVKANELFKAGDHAGAKSIMSRWNAQTGQREVVGPPKSQPAATPAAPQPSAVAGLSDNADPNAQSEAMAADDWGASQKPQLHPFVQMAQEQDRRKIQTLLGTGPGGRQWSLDPEAQREAGLQRMQGAIAGAGDDPSVKALAPQMLMVQQATGQELDPREMFGQFRTHANVERQEAAATERERMRIEAEKRKAVEFDRRFDKLEPGRNFRAIQGNQFRGATVEQGEKRLELSTETAARTATKEVLGQFGFKGELAQFHKFNQMGDQFTQKNAALDAAVAGSWVKQAQGGSGVISDADMEAFWNRIGSFAERTGEWISKALSGESSPEIRAKVTDAVKWLAAQNQARLGEAQEALSYHLKSSPSLSGFHDQMVGTYFSGSRKQENQGGGSQRALAGKMPKDMADWIRDNPGPKADAVRKKWEADNGVRP